MAKSKLVEANEKIAEKVVDTYKKIEDTVVGGYTKIEDAFVDRYLTKEGESVEEAKTRLKHDRNTQKKLVKSGESAGYRSEWYTTFSPVHH